MWYVGDAERDIQAGKLRHADSVAWYVIGLRTSSRWGDAYINAPLDV